MDNQDLKELIEVLNLEECIKLSSIPNIDLYMDQVITLFEEKLACTKRNNTDKLLTKTMINNYIKDKLLMPAVKKKYTREHILLMILLYELKQILTMGDIKALFGAIIKEGEVNSVALEELYTTYLGFREQSVNIFNTEVIRIQEEMQGVLAENQEAKDMLQVILLTQKANYYKRLAEKIIDEKIIRKQGK